MQISIDDKIGDILGDYPQLLSVFKAKGLNFDSATQLIDALGKDTKLRTVLKVIDINADSFVVMLNERLGVDMSLQQISYDFYNPELPVNLLVKTACPINSLFKDELNNQINRQMELTGKPFNTYLVDGCNASHDFDNFWEQESIDALPDIIMSMSFDEIFDGRFINKFVKTGYFENVLTIDRAEYKYVNYQDDSYTLLASLALIMLIDEEKLGDLPAPKRWEDLLDPIYKDKIVGFGNNDRIFEYSMFYFDKEFGKSGLEKLARNTKSIFHAAKMAKLVGTNNPSAGAIYIMPLTFADLCPKKGTTIIYPEDGAWLIPISFLAKKDKISEMRIILDFITNTYGQMCADINAACFNPKVKNRISPDVKLKWLGWDYIKSTDIYGLGERLCNEFHYFYDNKPKSENE